MQGVAEAGVEVFPGVARHPMVQSNQPVHAGQIPVPTGATEKAMPVQTVATEEMMPVMIGVTEETMSVMTGVTTETMSAMTDVTIMKTGAGSGQERFLQSLRFVHLRVM
jgi:hypothetical protein